MEKLISYFNNYLSLNENEKAELIARFTKRQIKRRQFILQEGDVLAQLSAHRHASSGLEWWTLGLRRAVSGRLTGI